MRARGFPSFRTWFLLVTLVAVQAVGGCAETPAEESDPGGTGSGATGGGGGSGGSNGCTNGSAMCGGSCIDVMSDSQNCGACRAACGGTCGSGDGARTGRWLGRSAAPLTDRQDRTRRLTDDVLCRRYAQRLGASTGICQRTHKLKSALETIQLVRHYKIQHVEGKQAFHFLACNRIFIRNGVVGEFLGKFIVSSLCSVLQPT